MTNEEIKKGLKAVYDKAIKCPDLRLAFDVLQVLSTLNDKNLPKDLAEAIEARQNALENDYCSSGKYQGLSASEITGRLVQLTKDLL